MKKLIIALAALALMAGSAYAADWNFYGSARVQTFYNDVETINSTTADTKNISESLQSNSRIGANVKVSDELRGRFEYGTGVNVRLLYGEWNFGPGKLLVGQDYSPFYLPGSGQVYAVDAGLGGWGEAGGDRKAQLKLKFGEFQIAAIAPNTNFTQGNGATPGTVGMVNGMTTASAVVNFGTTAAEVKLPLIEARYTLRGDNWDIRIAGAYQTFEVNTASTTTAAQDITSYMLAIGGNMTIGQLAMGAEVHGGENPGNIMPADVNGFQTAGGDSNNGLAYYDTTGNKVYDNEAFGWRAYLLYTFNDMFAVEVGYGQQKVEYDLAGSTADEVSSYYLQVPVTLAPGVFVVPEIGVLDYQETGQQETTYFGAKWQINF